MGGVRVEEREQALSEEDIHNVLRNKRRRYTIEYLRQNGDQTQVRDLSEHIAERETDESPAPRNIRNSVYVALHQTHLPKLDHHDLVEYDTNRKTVELADGARELEPYFEGGESEEFPWALFYLSCSLTASVVIAASVAEIPIIGFIEPIVWAVGYVLLALALIAFELFRRRERFDGNLIPESPITE